MTYTPSDYRAAGVRAVKCTARTHAGKPCKMWAARGATVCKMHRGAAPQVKAAARRRLEQATDALAAKLLGIALDDGASEAVRLAAIRDALDRGGVSAKTAVSVEVGTPAYVEVFDALVSTPVTSAAEEPLAISGEPTGGPLRPAQSAKRTHRRSWCADTRRGCGCRGRRPTTTTKAGKGEWLGRLRVRGG